MAPVTSEARADLQALNYEALPQQRCYHKQFGAWVGAICSIGLGYILLLAKRAFATKPVPEVAIQCTELVMIFIIPSAVLGVLSYVSFAGRKWTQLFSCWAAVAALMAMAAFAL
jgi:putative effector of murein hydrolase LrgA (UPF0299 family)